MKTKIINSIYSFGAVAVVAGAWAKIEHFAVADIMLTIGLLTEAGIFFLYGIQELVSKPSITGSAHSPEYPTQDRLEAAVKETNAILRDVYKTRI